MGYFPNNTEAEIYQSQWCSRCQHGPHQEENPCGVWLAHFIHNYKHCDDDRSPLHILIPRDKAFNLQCSMFLQRDMPDPRQADLLDMDKDRYE